MELFTYKDIKGLDALQDIFHRVVFWENPDGSSDLTDSIVYVWDILIPHRNKGNIPLFINGCKTISC
jgi:hypothetical protein